MRPSVLNPYYRQERERLASQGWKYDGYVEELGTLVFSKKENGKVKFATVGKYTYGRIS